MLLTLFLCFAQSIKKLCICNNECSAQCPEETFIYKQSNAHLKSYLLSHFKKEISIEIDLFSTKEGFSFEIDQEFLDSSKINLMTLSDSKPINVILKTKNNKKDKMITIQPGNYFSSSIDNYSDKPSLNSQKSVSNNLNPSDKSYINKQFLHYFNNEILINANSPITQISGNSFTDIESNIDHLIKLEKEVSFYDNSFSFNEKSQKTVSPLFVNYKGKLRISHCTFTNAKFGKKDDGNILTTSQSQIDLAFDSCSFKNCGNSKSQTLIRISNEKSSLKMIDCDVTFDNKESSAKVLDSKSSDVKIDGCKISKSAINSILIRSQSDKGTFEFTNNEISFLNGRFFDINKLATKPLISGNVFHDIEINDKFLISCLHDQKEIEIEKTTFLKIRGALSFCFEKISDASQCKLVFTKCNFCDNQNGPIQFGDQLSIEKSSLMFQACQFKHCNYENGKSGILEINCNNEIDFNSCVFEGNSVGPEGCSIYIAKTHSNLDKNIMIENCNFSIEKGSNGCYIYHDNDRNLQITSCSFLNKIQSPNNDKFAIYSESKEFTFESNIVEFKNPSKNNLVFNLKSSKWIQIENCEFINCINQDQPGFRFDGQTEKSTTNIVDCDFKSTKSASFLVKITGGVSNINSCYMNHCSLKMEYAGTASIKRCITSNCDSIQVNYAPNDLRIKEEEALIPFEISDNVYENEDIVNGYIIQLTVNSLIYKNNSAVITGQNNYNGMYLNVKGSFTFLDSSFTNFGGSAIIFSDGSNDDLTINVTNCTFDKCQNNIFFKFQSTDYQLSNSVFQDIVFSKESSNANEEEINNLIQFDTNFASINVDSCSFTRCSSESNKKLTSIIFTPRDDNNVKTLNVNNCKFESCKSPNYMYCILTWTRMKNVNINNNEFYECQFSSEECYVIFATATEVNIESNNIKYEDSSKGCNAIRVTTSTEITIKNSQFIRTNSKQCLWLVPNDNGNVFLENCEWHGNIGSETRCFKIQGLRNPASFKNNTFDSLPAGSSIGEISFEQPSELQTIEDTKFINNNGLNENGSGVLLKLENITTLKFVNCEWNDNKPSTGSILAENAYESNLIYEICHFVSNEATTNGGALNILSNKAVTFKNCEFKSNQSPNGKGGAIGLQVKEDLLIDHCIFEGNSAKDDGKCIHIFQSNTNENKVIEIIGCDFIIDSNQGGYIIYDQDVKALQITTCSFTDKTQKQQEIKIKNENKEITVDNCTIEYATIEIQPLGDLKIVNSNFDKSFLIANQENQEHEAIIEGNTFSNANIDTTKYIVQINSAIVTYQKNSIKTENSNSFNGVIFNRKGSFDVINSKFLNVKGNPLTFTDLSNSELILNVTECTFDKCQNNIFFKFQSTDYQLSNSVFQDIVFSKESSNANEEEINNLIQFDTNFASINVDSCSFTRCSSESNKKLTSIIFTPRDDNNVKTLNVNNCKFESCKSPNYMYCILTWTRMKNVNINNNEFYECQFSSEECYVIFATATEVNIESNNIKYEDSSKGCNAIRVTTSTEITIKNSQFIRTNSKQCLWLVPNDNGNVFLENCEWHGNIGSETRCFKIQGLRNPASFKNNTFDSLPAGSSIGEISFEQPSELQTIEDTKFIDNAGNSLYGVGTPLITQNISSLIFINCEWIRNSAVYSQQDSNRGGYSNGNGGAFQFGYSEEFYQMKLEFNGCLFDSNKAESYGGALSISTILPVKILNCEFRNNQAGIKEDNQDPHHGGAIYFDTDFSYNGKPPSRMESATISNCTFNENSANNQGKGNSIYIKGNLETTFTINQNTKFTNTLNTAEIASQSSKLILNEVDFSLTSTNGLSSPILFDNNKVDIQGKSYQKVKTNTNSIFDFKDQTEVSLNECEFIDCESLKYIISTSSNLFKFENSKIKYSSDLLNAGLDIVSKESVTINLCNFSKCAYKEPIQGTQGGAIHLTTSADKTNCIIDIKNCRFEECHADFGGGIYYETEIPTIQFKLTECQFVGNTADTAGGSVYFKSIQGEVTKCTFINNNGKKGSDFYYDCNVKEASSVPFNKEGLTISGCVFEQEKEHSSLIHIITKENAFFNFNQNNITISNNVTYIFDSDEYTTLLGNWSFSGNRLDAPNISIKTETAVELPVDCGQGFLCDLPFIPSCPPGGRCDIDSSSGDDDENKITFIYINETEFKGFEYITDGGSIHLINCGIDCQNNKFVDCVSKEGSGGGIYIYLDKEIEQLVDIHDCSFTGCGALCGGAICAISAKVENNLSIKKCQFTLNKILTGTSKSQLSGGSAIYVNFPKARIKGCSFIKNTGKGGSVKIVYFEDKEEGSLRKLDTNKYDISLLNCFFEIDSKSSCSLYYDRGESESIPVNVKNCIFTGDLSKDAHHIDGSISSSKINININACKFSLNSKFAINEKLINSFDYKSQEFNYKDKNDTEKIQVAKDHSKTSIATLCCLFAALLVVAVVIAILVKNKINQNENDLIDDADEIMNLNFSEVTQI